MRLAFPLLALLVAGCLAPVAPTPPEDRPPLAPSTPIHDRIERSEFDLETIAGKVRVELHRPEGPGPFPVILVLTPYRWMAPLGCRSTDLSECPLDLTLVQHYAPRGYAVAFADAPGFHGSDGCADMAGRQSARAGAEVVEALGAMPWSSGRVGLYGGSYEADLALAAAAQQPVHLAALVLIAATSSGYHDQYYAGVPYWTKGEGRTAFYSAITAVPHAGAAPASGRGSCAAEVLAAGSGGSGDWSAYWEERDYRPAAPSLRVPLLQVHGWRDTNVHPDQVFDFWPAYGGEKRLILGHWEHQLPDRPDWPAILHRWFDHWLLERDTGLLEELPPVLSQDEEGEWWGLPDLAPGQTILLWPHHDGTLRPGPPAPASLPIRDWPRASFAGPVGALVSAAGAVRGEPGEHRFDADVPGELRVFGRPVLHFSAVTEAASTHWAARLVEVRPDSADPVASDGGARDTFTRGYQDTRHLRGPDAPRDLAPGERYEVRLVFLPRSETVAAAHGLRLLLSNNDNWVEQDSTYAASEVHLGPGTILSIPLAPAGIPIPPDAFS